MSLTDLAQLIGAEPKQFLEGLVATNDFVYEVDPDLINPEDNPYGIGTVIGAVLDPHGEYLKVKWFDDNGVDRNYTKEIFAESSPNWRM